MKIKIVVKQKEEREITMDSVRTYYVDKFFLEVIFDNKKKSKFKTTTVLSIEEI